jgi:hypothetical protein
MAPARYHDGMTVIGHARMCLGLCTLAGCSLLYNPNNLPDPRVDAAPPPDAMIDSDPTMPQITAFAPAELFEGQGTGGSRQAVLVISGRNFGADATVALAAVDGSAPMIQIDNDHAVRSDDLIAVPITLPVDPAVPARNTDAPVTTEMALTVSQTSAAGVVHTPVLDTTVKLTSLPELSAPITSSNLLTGHYSQVMTGALVFAAGGKAAVLRVEGSITLGDVTANGGAGTGGPGGGNGGAASANGAGPSPGKGAGALVGASGAGYASAGGGGMGVGSNPGGGIVGDEYVTSYAQNNRSSGGGGGGSAPGGGGGGTLELTAGGTLTVGKLTARGGSAGANGGGGSGGTIVVRANGPATVGAIDASGSAGGDGNAGAGGVGRVRYDLASLDAPAVTAGVFRRGLIFPAATDANPLITRAPRPMFSVTGVASSARFNVFVLFDGSTTYSTTITLGSATGVITLDNKLMPGLNRLCVTPPAGLPTNDESANCISVAYVP